MMNEGSSDLEKTDILVALSGGADSVYLLLSLVNKGETVEAVHCNFHLRGEESDRDEEFCKRLCERKGVKLHVAHFDTREYAALHKISIELAARRLRYDYFEQLRQEIGAKFIAVAHHKDDQVETIIHNLARGTGIKGLCGMKKVNGHIVRPLLDITRAEIEAQLSDWHETYVTDSTNLEDEATRNKIRHHIIPLLKEINPKAVENIARMAHHLAETARIEEKYYEKHPSTQPPSNSPRGGEGLIYVFSPESAIKTIKSPSPLLGESEEGSAELEAYLHYQLSAKGFNRTQIANIIAALRNPETKTFSSKDYIVDVCRHKLYISENKPDTFEEKRTPSGNLLRRPKPGDRFRPKGLRGTKLISDYMNEKKLTPPQKRQVVVVENSEGRIVDLLGKWMLCILALFVMTTASAKIVVTKTTCNGQTGNAIIVGNTATVGWQLSSDTNNDRQTAYQIELAPQPPSPLKGELVRLSGKGSAQSITLPQPASPLKGKLEGGAATPPSGGWGAEGGTYLWRVRVWDAKKQPSEWSDWQLFHIAPKSIDAKWVGATDNPDDSLGTKSIEILKPFTLKQAAQNIADAVVYICGLGHYTMDINGERVNDAEFAPLWTDYGKTVYYNIISLTPPPPLKGELERVGLIRVTLGNGMYNVKKDGRYAKFQNSFGAPKLLMQMIINYKDGSSQTINTDGTEQYRQSPIVFNSIYGGESYDENKEDQPLHPVKIVTPPAGKLLPQTAPSVKIMGRHGVKSWKYAQMPVAKNSDSTKQVIVCDMGQNLSGFPEIRFRVERKEERGKRKEPYTITLTPAEKLDDKGCCSQKQTGRPHYYSLTLSGERTEGVWHPNFSYYGFRYIQVEGAVMKGEPNPDNLPVIEDLASCFTHLSAEGYSRFESANPLFTKTHQLILNAERSNMQSVFTDCPHREKLGWLEQDHLNGPSLLQNFNLTTFGSKLMRDICDAQKEDGQVPTIAPQYVVFGNKWGDFDESVEWGSTLIIFPFEYYERYGDNSLILDNYDSMCKYVDYLHKQRNEEGIITFGLGDWYDFLPETAAGFSRNTPVPLVGTAHYIYDLQLMVKASKMKKDKLHLNIYKERLAQAIADFNSKYFHTDSCYYGNNSQCSNALPLFLGICPKGTEQAVYGNLIADIMKTGKPRLTTGDVGNRYLIQTLARKGDNQMVYDMFNHYETPGYGYQMLQDMTTLSEQWNPKFGASLNHFMMGQLDEWLFQSMAGIRNAEGTVGLTDIIIQPFLTKDNPHVAAETANLYGKIAVNATLGGNIEVEIPIGCRATIIDNKGKKTKVGSGKHCVKNEE